MSAVTPARKAVASAVSGLSGWSVFAIFTGNHGVSWSEWGYLVTIATGVFLAWYVPNNVPATWQPQDREGGKVDMGDALALLVVVLCLLLVLRAFGYVGGPR